MSRDAQDLQLILRRTTSPTDLFFRQFPKLAGTEDFETVVARIEALHRELAGVTELYRNRVERAVRITLGLGVPSLKNRD